VEIFFIPWPRRGLRVIQAAWTTGCSGLDLQPHGRYMAQQTRIGSRCLVAVALLATYCSPVLAFAPHGMLATSRAMSRGAGPLALAAARLGGTKRRMATLGSALRSFGTVPLSWHRSRYLLRTQHESAAQGRCRTCGAADRHGPAPCGHLFGVDVLAFQCNAVACHLHSPHVLTCVCVCVLACSQGR
jgi:hypothetical protein